MNEFTKLELQRLLSIFDDEGLFSLTATTTKRLLPKNKIVSRQDAIMAIINYSTDVLSILHRKIVTKEILFYYAHDRKLHIQLPPTKHNLIETILTYWNDSDNVESFMPEQPLHHLPVSILAQQFIEWFYSLMNKNECIESSHFYPDAKLKVNVTKNGATFTESVENNPQGIVEKLFSTKMSFNLSFNPNLAPQGAQGRIDPHGLVIVLACGTLHADGGCMGVFEQVFGLVRDPISENNWKIKFTELNLKSQAGSSEQPTVCDDELTSSFLSLPAC